MTSRGLGMLVVAAALGWTTVAGAAETKLTIKGRVVTPEAKPIASATVYVYTAQPRVGIGSMCASCYPECGKQVQTDRGGRFTVAGLSDKLLYRLLFVADGRVPEFHDKVDPLAGSLEQVLRVRDTVLAPGLRTTVGHVVGPDGKPVAGATVFPQGIKLPGDRWAFGDFSSRPWGRIDPMAVTDRNGAFHLTGPDSIEAWVLGVKARDLCPRAFPDIRADGQGALLKLDRGATVTGQVVRDGEPVPGAVIGITQADRDAMTSVSPDTIAADERGRFTFFNVPPAQDHVFSGVVGSMGPWALRSIVRTVGEADSVTALPPLAVERGFRLKGRVTLGDGKPVPAGTELTLARSLSAGAMVIPMDAEGRFDLEGIPPETVMLGIRVKGYRLTPSTPGYVAGYRSMVRLPMLRDRTDVEIVLEPAPPAPTATSTAPRP